MHKMILKNIIKKSKNCHLYHQKKLDTNKFVNTVVFVNHELFPVDILIGAYYIKNYLNLQTAIVVANNKNDFEINKKMFPNFVLIPLGNATNDIIDLLKKKYTILIYLNWLEQQRLLERTFLDVIYEYCNPIMMTIDTCENLSKEYLYHPIIHAHITNTYIKKYNNNKTKKQFTNGDIKMNCRIITGGRVKIMKYLFNEKINIYITSSDPFVNSNEFKQNITFLGKLYMKGEEMINCDLYNEINLNVKEYI